MRTTHFHIKANIFDGTNAVGQVNRQLVGGELCLQELAQVVLDEVDANAFLDILSQEV